MDEALGALPGQALTICLESSVPSATPKVSGLRGGWSQTENFPLTESNTGISQLFLEKAR